MKRSLFRGGLVVAIFAIPFGALAQDPVVAPLPKLAEKIGATDARLILFEQLDSMGPRQLIEVHELFALLGHRLGAVGGELTYPPKLEAARSELAAFFSSSDELRIPDVYEIYRQHHASWQGDLAPAREHLASAFPPEVANPPELQEVSSAVHEDGDGSSWTNSDCRESPPDGHLNQQHFASVREYGGCMYCMLCVPSEAINACDEHMHRAYEACVLDAENRGVFPRNVNSHCLAHTTEMQRCWTDNGWIGRCNQSRDCGTCARHVL